jgi:hypothetical protein
MIAILYLAVLGHWAIGQPGPQLFYFSFPAVHGATGSCHNAQQFSVELGSREGLLFI